MQTGYSIYAIGDSAISFDLGNGISLQRNHKVLAMRQWLLQHPFDGMKDVIPAYSSVSVMYDPVLVRSHHKASPTAFEYVKDRLEAAWQQSAAMPDRANRPIASIPVCYDHEFGYDLAYISEQKQLPPERIVELHLSKQYTVYLIGFLPGFPYMAEVDERIVIPRKIKPVQVAAGSVGIAGSQTGVYSLNCPGGWQIIGRTPLKLFDAAAEPPVLLEAGDEVRFYPISREVFDHWGA